MPRPKVTHCKDCRYYKDRNSDRDSYSWHYCCLYDRTISGQAVRTSPRWCRFHFIRMY